MKLQSISTPKLKPGYGKDLKVNTKLPSSVGFGSGLYIVIVADADGKIDEPDWDNNYLWLGPMDPVTESYTIPRRPLKDIKKWVRTDHPEFLI